MRLHFFIFFILFLFSKTAVCCSCRPLGKIDEKQFKQYDLIVKGKVVNVIEKNMKRIITIKVLTYYKGQHKTNTVKISSASQSGVCGIFPKVGEQWLIFAYGSLNNLSTNLCTRTKSMNRKEWDYNKQELMSDLKFLDGKIKNSSR